MAKQKSSSKKKTAAPAGEPEPELTPKQIKEKRREEARTRAAETRKVVAQGTTAWTGKLPAQLLNEHCQKMKWERVDYPIKGGGDSFRAMVILGKKNPKTQEIERVRIDPPADRVPTQPTAVEARHFAATYAMHRVLSHRNMKLMLPPTHRDLWIQLDADKTAAPARDRWLWSEDPFQAQIEHRRTQQKIREDSTERQERADAAKLRATISRAQDSESVRSSKSEDSEDGESNQLKPHTRRVRFNTTLVMTRRMQSTVEAVIREQRAFRFSHDDALPKNSEKYPMLIDALQKLGFAPFMAREALDYSNSLSQALVWLLVHVPEDDLPSAFVPQGIGVTARVSYGAVAESAVARIRIFGYTEDIARVAFQDTGSIPQAMVKLTHGFIEGEPYSNMEPDANTDAAEMWTEECDSLKAVYDAQFHVDAPDTCSITLECGLKAVFFRPTHYPTQVPGIGLEPNGGKTVPKYVLLDAARRAAVYASQHLSGSYMLAELAQYIDDTFSDVQAHPSPLTQISSGVSGVQETPKREREHIKQQSVRKSPSKKPKLDSAQLQRYLQQRRNSTEGIDMLKARKQLPAWQKREEVLELIQKHQVVLVTGETGSGKSTQIVQFVLDSMIESGKGSEVSVICTQPRRIAAVGVAQRVAEERCSPIGKEVGYVIRGETRVGVDTQLRFVTAGVLLRMLQTDSDGTLAGLSHVVVDEVHERTLDGDLLLILLKRVLKRHPHLKVVLMSATVDPRQFQSYFEETAGKVGHTHITGRTFPVKQVYLPDILVKTRYVPPNVAGSVEPGDVGRLVLALRDGIDFGLVAATVSHIHNDLGSESGSILVFMSGAAEIDRVLNALTRVDAASELWCLPLHASLPPSEQRRVFQSPPRGLRKVIISTNVAETSITISDVVAVVDSGRVKETIYEADKNLTRLVDTWTSLAAATQRMGRAGRVRAGTCYKLYTDVLEARMLPKPPPEMLRAPLDVLYLSVKAMGIGNVSRFLSGALDPPKAEALDTARQQLVAYGALDPVSDQLTPLGMHMSLLPTDPRTAKLLVLGAMLGCLPRCLTVAALLGVSKSLFQAPRELPEAKEHHKRSFVGSTSGSDGDLLSATRAFESWMAAGSASRKWAQENYINHQTARDVQSARQQLLGALTLTGFVPPGPESKLPGEMTAANYSWSLLRAIIGAALRPQIAEIVPPAQQFRQAIGGSVEVDPEARQIRYFTCDGVRVFIHPRSLLFDATKFADDARFMAYASALVSTRHFIADLTPVTAFGVALFASRIDIDPLGSGVVVDRWTGLRCIPRAGVLLQFLQRLFTDVLAIKFDNPRADISRNRTIHAVQELLETDGRGRDTA